MVTTQVLSEDLRQLKDYLREPSLQAQMWLLETAASRVQRRKQPYLTPRQKEILSARYYDDSELKSLEVTGGARAGKSQVTADWLFMGHLGDDLQWVMAPDYEQARNELRYVQELLVAIGNFDAERSSMPTAQFQPWTLWTKTGCEITTKTVSDLEKIAGRAPDRIAMVEAGQMPKEALYRARERLMEKGGKLLLNGTLEQSQQWYGEIYEEWQTVNEMRGRSMSLPTFSNVHLFPKGENDPKFLEYIAGLPHDYVMERFYGIPRKPAGLVHPEFSTIKHASLERWPISYENILARLETGSALVQLWIDPGYAGGSAVEFFTVIDGLVFGLDEIFTRGLITDQVIDATVTHPLYKYVSHIVMDVAGRQHNSMKSPKEVWMAETHLPVLDTGSSLAIVDGILRTASFFIDDPILKHPKAFLHPKMDNAIWEYTRGYKRPVDADGKVLGEKPIDKNNHAAKAIAYGLVVNFGLAQARNVYGAAERADRPWMRRRHGISRRK